MRLLLALVPLCFVPAACNSGSCQSKPVAVEVPAAVAEQIARGVVVYGEYCAKCHGDGGQGTQRGPLLVGDGAFPLNARHEDGRADQFHTALDVAGFVTHNMPPVPKKRDEIAASDYWATLAFAISANGIALTEVLGPKNAATIVLNP